MKKGLATFSILLILLCSISGSAYARGNMSDKAGLGPRDNLFDKAGLGPWEDLSDKAVLGPRANGFTNLIDSKIELLENKIENSDDLSFIEEAGIMIFELEHVRDEIQESSNEREFASSLNKFNSLMENSSEDLEQIFMSNQETSVARIAALRNVSVSMNDVRNKSVRMNNASGDRKSLILKAERENPIKNVSSISTIVNGNKNKASSSNSNFLTSFVNKIMSFF